MQAMHVLVLKSYIKSWVLVCLLLSRFIQSYHDALDVIHQRRISEEVVHRGEYFTCLSRRVTAGVHTPADRSVGTNKSTFLYKTCLKTIQFCVYNVYLNISH